MADELDRLSDEEYFERNYSGHGRGVVITNENGKFVERQMTNAELWARKPALEIAADIHKLACYAAFAYIKCWEFIAPVIETAMSGRDVEIASLRTQLALKDWQTIDTAPRDGTLILACNTRMANVMAIVGWDSVEDGWTNTGNSNAANAMYFNGSYFDYWMPRPAVPNHTEEPRG